MRHLHARFKPAPLALTVALALGISGMVHAQATPMEKPIAISIAAQSLDTALNELAAATGVSVAFSPDLVAGKTAPTINGDLTPREAVNQLLAGSGLVATQEGESIAIKSGHPPEETVLPAVKVMAGVESEVATGPVQGYVAKRSFTATKVDIPLLETPQSVSVIAADQIEIQNAESLAQALKYTSGIQASGGGEGSTFDGFTIRGFNVTGSAPTYLNGAKLARNSFSGVTEPYAMERIEILKGPASVLYGNAAPGGIINMVSKLPQVEAVHELKLQVGSFDRKQIAGDIGGEISEDGVWSYRIIALMRHSNTMVDYTPDDRDFGAGSIRWQPSEGTSLILLANYQRNETSYYYGLPAAGTVLSNANGHISRSRFIGEPDFDTFDVTNYTLGYLFSHRFNEALTFRQNLLYFKAETNSDAIWAGSLDSTQRLLSRRVVLRDDKDSSWTLDNQLEAKWHSGSVEHTTLVGADYMSWELGRLQRGGTVAPLDLFNPQYGSPVTINAVPVQHWRDNSHQLGIYAQEHMKIADSWVAILGGRYDKVEAKEKNLLSVTDQTTDLYDDSAFTARVGVIKLFDNGVAPYVSYSESFEPASGRDVGGKTFEPTQGEQYEAGIRYQPEGQAISMSASVYKLTQTNVSTLDANNPGFSVQEGEVESRGVELEVQVHITQALNLIASAGYIDNEVTKSNSGTEGNRAPGVPSRTAAIWSDYRATSALLLGAGVRYFGESAGNFADTIDVPSYTVVDAVAQYRLAPAWQVALNFNNIFDKRYATCTYACFYGEARSTKATLTYQW